MFLAVTRCASCPSVAGRSRREAFLTRAAALHSRSGRYNRRPNRARCCRGCWIDLLFSLRRRGCAVDPWLTMTQSPSRRASSIDVLARERSDHPGRRPAPFVSLAPPEISLARPPPGGIAAGVEPRQRNLRQSRRNPSAMPGRARQAGPGSPRSPAITETTVSSGQFCFAYSPSVCRRYGRPHVVGAVKRRAGNRIAAPAPECGGAFLAARDLGVDVSIVP